MKEEEATRINTNKRYQVYILVQSCEDDGTVLYPTFRNILPWLRQ